MAFWNRSKEQVRQPEGDGYIQNPRITPEEQRRTWDELRGPGTPPPPTGHTPLDIVDEYKRNPRRDTSIS